MRRLLFVSRHYASDFSGKIGGVFQRLRMLLDAAALSADSIDLLFFVDQKTIDEVGPAVAEASLNAHWKIATRVHFAPRAAMRHGALVQTLLSTIDFRAQDDYFRFNGTVQYDAIRSCLRPDTGLIVAHRLYTGSTVVAADHGDIPVVMDLDDIEHRSRARQLATAARPSRFGRLELPALKRGELATLRACRTSFVCSQVDRDYLAGEGVVNTTVIPNAMRFADAPAANDAPAGPPTLFFIGAYGYAPNADAAENLIGTIFPLVRERRPDTRLLIVGEAVEKLPSHGRRPEGVEFAGYVPDLSDVYRRATVVCCPIRAGGGTRIKIIEAAARRKPVVSTTIGAEGLALVNETEILLRDTAQGFADACIALLDDPARGAALGAAAFRKARSLYERTEVVDRIARAFVDSAGGPP